VMLDTTTRDRIEFLEEENRWLRDKIARLEGRDETVRSRLSFGLTKYEAALFSLMLRCGHGTYDALADAIWNGIDEPRDLFWAIRHHMKRLRKKLRPHGIDFETVYGIGYRMSDEARARARAAFKAEGVV
jgi:DNA-binding response OmpR family regulator